MPDPLATIHRLIDATNSHDLDRVVACFADDYTLVSPSHPHRAFRGSDQVRRNWSQIFAGFPISSPTPAVGRRRRRRLDRMGDVGTRPDRAAHRMAGVFVFGVIDDRIQWGRMFLEPVDEAGGDINAALRAQVSGT